MSLSWTSTCRSWMGWSSSDISGATENPPARVIIVTTEGREDDYKRARSGRERLPQKAVHPRGADRVAARSARKSDPGRGQYVSEADAPASKPGDGQRTESGITDRLVARGAGSQRPCRRARAIAGAAEMVDPDLLYRGRRRPSGFSASQCRHGRSGDGRLPQRSGARPRAAPS